MRRALAAGLLVASSIAAPGVAAQPATPFDDATWSLGALAFGYVQVCDPLPCRDEGVLHARVAVRGPEGAISRTPVVGERFFVRTWVGLLVSSVGAVDTYRTQVVLPTGLAPAIDADDDLMCAITTSNSSEVLRPPAAGECARPVESGGVWTLPAVALTNDDQGQVAQFWFPVVATQPLAGATITVRGTAVLNALGIDPNPVVAEVGVRVDAAPAPSAPTPTGTDASAATGATGTGTALRAVTRFTATPRRGAVVVAWRPPTATGVTGYRVQARIAGTRRWRAVGTAPRTARTFRWKRARRGTTYYLRVAPLYGTRLGAWSRAVRVRAR